MLGKVTCNSLCNISGNIPCNICVIWHVVYVMKDVITCKSWCNRSCHQFSHSCNYLMYYMSITWCITWPIHETKIFNSPHVMACNGHVITWHYMVLHHYMPLHAGQDANDYESGDPCFTFVVIYKLNAPISSDDRNFRIQFEFEIASPWSPLEIVIILHLSWNNLHRSTARRRALHLARYVKWFRRIKLKSFARDINCCFFVSSIISVNWRVTSRNFENMLADE